jgi:hypothetical protein
MKKRYLFPIVWIVVEISSYVLPVLFPVVYLFSIPSMIIVNPLVRALDGPIDTYYFVVFGTILQAFLLGYLWDLMTEKLINKKNHIR